MFKRFWLEILRLIDHQHGSAAARILAVEEVLETLKKNPPVRPARPAYEKR